MAAIESVEHRYQRLFSAKSCLAAERRPIDWTEATLPVTGDSVRSLPGPKLPVVVVSANVGFEQAGMIARLLHRVQTSSGIEEAAKSGSHHELVFP